MRLYTPRTPHAWIDAFPGPAVGCTIGYALTTLPSVPPSLDALLLHAGGLVGLVVWPSLPLAPRLSNARLRRLLDDLLLPAWQADLPLAHAFLSPLTTSTYPNVPSFHLRLTTGMLADGIDEDPTLRALYRRLAQPFLLRVRPEPNWQEAFLLLAWKPPTTGHAVLERLAGLRS
jgi:hypothetical protein